MSDLVNRINRLETALKNTKEQVTYLNAYAQGVNQQLGQVSKALFTISTSQGVVKLKEIEMTKEEFEKYQYLFYSLFMDKESKQLVNIQPILAGWEHISSTSDTEHVFGNSSIPTGDGMAKRIVYGPLNEANGKLSELLRSEYYLERDKAAE